MERDVSDVQQVETPARILIVDDDGLIRALLTDLLQSKGMNVVAVGTIADANARLDTDPFDLAMLDKNLPDGSGLDLARRIVEQRQEKEQHTDTEAPEMEVIVMSGFANLDSALEALQLEVSDYLVKPFRSPEEVLSRCGASSIYWPSSAATGSCSTS